MRTVGAAMVSSMGIRAAAAVLLVLLDFAVGRAQMPDKLFTAAAIVPSAIANVPPLARAVLSGDPKEVISLLEKAPQTLDERVRAEDGSRAGFTPLILAAAISDPEIAGILIRRGAKITILDDFNRSAFWYAALRQDAKLTSVLIQAPAGNEVVNAADNDLKRTPLHLAVRGNSPAVVDLLIKVGASGDQKDILGETPADYCEHNFTSACKELRLKK